MGLLQLRDHMVPKCQAEDGGAKVQVTGHCFTNTESIPNTCES